MTKSLSSLPIKCSHRLVQASQLFSNGLHVRRLYRSRQQQFGAQYVAAVSIAPIGIVSLTLLAAQTPAFLSMPAGSPNLFIRIVQTTPTAVGTAKLVINYST